MSDVPRSPRTRRPPPPFVRVAVSRTEQLTNRMMRVTFAGPDLQRLVAEPAASVRLLLPSPGTATLVVPDWDGNEFLLPDGTRPTIRTFTPRRFHGETGEIDLEIVLHPGGAASEWTESAGPGSPAAISGPGRGYVFNHEAASFFLAGDETAIPAVGQLLEALPTSAAVRVVLEVADPEARLPLPDHPNLTVTWCDLPSTAQPGDELLATVRAAEADADTQVWAAGEAAAMHRLRSYLFADLGLPRTQATVRGYWKRPRNTPRIATSKT